MAIHRAVERSIVTMASGSFLASLQKKRSAPASLNKTKCWDAVGENHDQKCDKNNRKEPVEDRVDQWWEPIRRCYLRAAAHRGLGCTLILYLKVGAKIPWNKSNIKEMRRSE